ncbi:M48 family metallopeptidase [Blastomonas fulva]|uniref:M48 family metallopeptidase n=1 Tax=Blastomonas fulva TaxID=1550728 RepID=UPI003F6F13E9
MPTLQIGRKEIFYELRRSATASERRITVTPGSVEVLALTNDNDDDIAGFLERKRQWVFNTVREMERITANRHAVPRFMTGSKIPYRGRKMPLTVRRTDAERAVVTYRNGFIVDLPHWTREDTDLLVASELKHWLKSRARRDVHEIANDYAKRFGLVPRSVRVADMTRGWGSCGPQGNLLINWNLIFAPKKVLEYVVAHELAHLRVRTHGPEFWAYLGTLMPQNASARAWLEQHDTDLLPRLFDGGN